MNSMLDVSCVKDDIDEDILRGSFHDDLKNNLLSPKTRNDILAFWHSAGTAVGTRLIFFLWTQKSEMSDVLALRFTA